MACPKIVRTKALRCERAQADTLRITSEGGLYVENAVDAETYDKFFPTAPQEAWSARINGAPVGVISRHKNGATVMQLQMINLTGGTHELVLTKDNVTGLQRKVVATPAGTIGLGANSNISIHPGASERQVAATLTTTTPGTFILQLSLKYPADNGWRAHFPGLDAGAQVTRVSGDTIVVSVTDFRPRKNSTELVIKRTVADPKPIQVASARIADTNAESISVDVASTPATESELSMNVVADDVSTAPDAFTLEIALRLL
jgi:hypothetical protein